MSLLEAKVKECFDVEALQVLAFDPVGLFVVDGGLGIGAFGVCGRAGPGGAEGRSFDLIFPFPDTKLLDAEKNPSLLIL